MVSAFACGDNSVSFGIGNRFDRWVVLVGSLAIRHPGFFIADAAVVTSRHPAKDIAVVTELTELIPVVPMAVLALAFSVAVACAAVCPLGLADALFGVFRHDTMETACALPLVTGLARFWHHAASA
jgi:hypothetical protein